MQDCNRITIRNVTARNYNGDGISWQICHDVLVEDCHSHDHTGLGLHPGSGSQRPMIRRNRMAGNDQGLFFCWGVKWALAEKNYIEGSKRYGISIGHHDTDNIVRDNEVRASGRGGHPVPQRAERRHFRGIAIVIEKNQILGVTKESGVGIDVQGQTQSITIVGNEIRETQGRLRSASGSGSDQRPIESRWPTIALKAFPNKCSTCARRVDRRRTAASRFQRSGQFNFSCKN